MNLLKSIWNAIKKLFKREEKKIVIREVSHMSLPPPIMKPQTLKFKQNRTKNGVKKHPLHKDHFSGFSPLRPI